MGYMFTPQKEHKQTSMQQSTFFLHLPFVSQTKAQQVTRSTKTPALIILYGCSPLPSLPLQPTFSRPWLWQALIAV